MKDTLIAVEINIIYIMNWQPTSVCTPLASRLAESGLVGGVVGGERKERKKST